MQNFHVINFALMWSTFSLLVINYTLFFFFFNLAPVLMNYDHYLETLTSYWYISSFYHI